MLVDNIPIPAPARTSEAQCLLFITRMTPTPVATVYAPMLYQTLLYPYSFAINVAAANAWAVCPDGNELGWPVSGRGTVVIFLSE